MARVKLNLPQQFQYSTEIPVRIDDVNYGGHLGNDSLLALLHEARVRFLGGMGYSEKDIEGVGIIMVDAVIVYRAESFHGDLLRIDLAVDDMQATGCDIFYRVVNVRDGREVARAKTGIAFFDYASRRVVPLPEGIRMRFRP